MKILAKVKYFNRNQIGHYAYDCTDPKKVIYYAHMNDFNVASSIFLSETNPMWIVVSGVTYNIARDRETFMHF